MRRSTQKLALLTACACWLSTTAFAQAAPVTAHLEPDTIAADQAATLTLTTDGSAAAEVPDIAGLRIEPIGTQTSMTITNGVGVQTVTKLYSVQAQGPGDYDIAGIRAGSAKAPKLTLHVQAAGSAPPSAASTADADPAASVDTGKLAFTRLRVDAQQIYTGQSVPFTLKAYFRGGTGVTLRGRPQLSSDAFTVSGLDQDPTQQEATISGAPYLVVTWHGTLSAAKAGDYPLDMTLPVSMQYREAAQAAPAQQPRGRSLRDLFGGHLPFGAGSPFDSMFDDSFFDSVFDEPLRGFGQLGRTVQRDLDLHGRAGNAHVEGLPSADQPADFSGAVGQFEIGAQLAQPALTQGEPVELQLNVQGTGNFGQFTPPTLDANADWKTYAGHTSFRAADKSGVRGELTLQQPIAAQHPGPMSVPALRFSYFDPDAGHYVTKVTAPIPVDVTPGQAAANTEQSDAPLATSATAADSGNASARAEEPSVRSLASGGVPPWLLPSALALLGLSALASAVVGVRRSQRYQQRIKRRAKQRAFQQELRAMQQAQRQGDRLAYLRAGRAALQRRLSASWGVPPESITVRELDARWPDAPESIRQLLERADEADYGKVRSASTGADFGIWAQGVDQQLSHIEVPS